VRAGEEGQAEKSERNTVDGEWADEPADEVGRRRVSERRGEAIRDIYTVNTWQREKTGRTPKTALSTVREKERKKKKTFPFRNFRRGHHYLISVASVIDLPSMISYLKEGRRDAPAGALSIKESFIALNAASIPFFDPLLGR